jgi:hypothetical protein
MATSCRPHAPFVSIQTSGLPKPEVLKKSLQKNRIGLRRKPKKNSPARLRAEEEKQGLIRWLRPEFQNPQGTKAATQVSLVEAGLEAAAPAKSAKGKKAAKLAWPKDLPARVVAARDLLAELGEATADDFPRRFKGVQTDKAEKLLESIAAVGVAIETTVASGSRRSWRLLR